jgi:hypothetical protein
VVKPGGFQLDAQRRFIDALQRARAEVPVNLDGESDDPLGQLI